LRILHVTPYGGDAWAYGGIPRVVDAISHGLARRGHHVTVCTTDACGAHERLAPSPPGWSADGGGSVEVVVFRNVSNRLAYRFQMYLPLGLRRYLRAHAAAFQVAHLHACHTFPAAIASRVLTRAGVPYIVAPNGTAPRNERRRLAKAIFDRTAGRRTLPDATRTLAVTQAERRQLIHLGVREPSIRVIPNPVDLAQFEPAVERGRFRAKHGVGDAPLALFLGRMSPRKRPDLMAAAVARLHRPDVRLAFAGNDAGAGRRLRSTIQRYDLQARTILTGLLTGRDRLAALADADVVVYPAHDEIFGLVAVEAVLCGTPVVVANDSGCGEVIDQIGGGLAVPGNADAIASALRTILADAAQWRMRAGQAGERARERYSSDAVCAELERTYGEMLGAGPASGRDVEPSHGLPYRPLA
jgi:glycosyltransferase involved in cell wall biosynthesis